MYHELEVLDARTLAEAGAQALLAATSCSPQSTAQENLLLAGAALLEDAGKRARDLHRQLADLLSGQ